MPQIGLASLSRETALTLGSPISAPGAVLAAIGRHDHVTLLPNRLQFIDDFPLLRGDRGRSRLLMLVTLADARHYNEILRALGHQFSEDFVRAGLARLRELLPETIAVYHVSVLSFAFVIDHGGENIPALADRVASAFKGDIVVSAIPIRSRVGVGLMPLDLALPDPAETLRAALVAAQDSRRGETGVAFYNHRSDAAHIRAFRILTDLPDAIRNPGQLSLAFQPRVDLATGRCEAAEALIRWQHSTLGAVSPLEFIPLAEQTALIHPLTEWVVDHALEAMRDFGRAGHQLSVSINASPLNLSEPGFDDRMFWSCDRFGISPEQVEIEFTEGILAPNQDRATRQLERLRAGGISIAIDDFGTGFSNLSYLRNIPADVLKIDQSFIRPLEPGDDFIVRQILVLARGLGLKACAEGIETAGVYDLLRALGCDEGQGYHIARPMPQSALVSWLSGSNPVPR